jgi:hypothetical protein
VYLQTVLTIP